MRLTHTRLLRTHFAGLTDVTKWNDLLRGCIRIAIERGHSVASLKQSVPAHIRAGRVSDNGYRYVAEADVSVQGVAADVAWRAVIEIAKLMREPVAVMFEWRDKEGAAHAGQTGQMVFKP